MPSRKAHEYASKIFFGRKFTEVHRAMDSPSKRLPGKSHRRLFHSYQSAVMIARMVSHDPDAPLAAIFHIDLDRMCSEDPYFSALVELRTKLASQRPKYRRRL